MNIERDSSLALVKEADDDEKKDKCVISIIQMLSIFPLNPPTKAEQRELNDAFAAYIPDHGVDVGKELWAYVQSEKHTVDERMMSQNEEKHTRITGMLDVLNTAARVAQNVFVADQAVEATAARARTAAAGRERAKTKQAIELTVFVPTLQPKPKHAVPPPTLERLFETSTTHTPPSGGSVQARRRVRPFCSTNPSTSRSRSRSRSRSKSKM